MESFCLGPTEPQSQVSFVRAVEVERNRTPRRIHSAATHPRHTSSTSSKQRFAARSGRNMINRDSAAGGINVPRFEGGESMCFPAYASELSVVF